MKLFKCHLIQKNYKAWGPVIKITLDIVTSKELKKSDVKAADKILTKILMLNSERGDSINFEFQDFPVTKKDEVKVGLPIEAKLMIVVLIITSLFLIVYILLKIKQLNINKEAVKAQQETAKATAAAGSGGGSSAPDPTPEVAAAPVPSGGGDSDVSGFFSFVGPHNIQQFISILKKKALPVDQLAIVVSYLPPQLSKGCIETLEDAQQVEVVTALSEEKIADKEMLSTLEGDLKSELKCSVGGAAKLGPVIATFNDPSKKTFLESIQSNADVYAQVRPTIFLFEDIEKLEDGDIKKLIGALKIEVLAAAIAKDDGGAAKKPKANLTGLKQWSLNLLI